MADLKCDHPSSSLLRGLCESCGVKTCQFDVTGCRCAVGWPYELQCPLCRDVGDRLDNGYCVCVPSVIPQRPAALEKADSQELSL
jgi:hypothetical protein